jgi:multidrug efflux system membrane fusion protein
MLAAIAVVGGGAYAFLQPGLQPGTGNPAAKKNAARAAGAAPVTTAIATQKDMPVILTAPGTVEALATVAVKTRVDGQIVKLGFEEGDHVKQDQMLFLLDDRLAKAQIKQAEANIAKDRASLVDAEAILARRETLVQKQYTSEASVETQRQVVAGLKASIAAGEAMLDAQKTQLDYLTIRAPITGRTGNLTAKLGATVRSGDAATLVTINQTSPILVTFSLPQSQLAAVRSALANKTSATVKIPVTGQTVPARISFVDNQVDRQTGTIMAKVTAENADEALWPGQSVDVALNVEVRPNVVSVPASAVLPSQDGMMAWVVDGNNKVAPRVVAVDRVVGQNAFLKDGLRAGERVVTLGQIRLAPGATVVIQEPHDGQPGDVAKDKAKEKPPAGSGRS